MDEVHVLIVSCAEDIACQPYFNLSDFHQTCSFLPHAFQYHNEVAVYIIVNFGITAITSTSEDTGLP